MTAVPVARLKITLDDVEPVVLRRVEVPFDISLDRLHLVVQAAMGWTDSHLYEFRVGRTGWGKPFPDWPDGSRDARKARLDEVVQDTGKKTLKYIYDFGDGWEHTIKVEKLIDPESGVRTLRLLDASGCCPPEDIGGPFGYAEVLEAIGDPEHERYEECVEWVPENFDPALANVKQLTDDLMVLAKRWLPKAAKHSKAI